MLMRNNRMDELNVIIPQWDAPDHVTALCTTRGGGVSEGGYAALNLASHVGDNPIAINQNRRRLLHAIGLPGEPQWLQQTHSIRVIDLDTGTNRDGDAALTRTPDTIATVLTADCLPVLFCNKSGSEVAAAHAGWRGLLNGVLEQTVNAMQSAAIDLMAWLGPAIGPEHFEVGEEVREAFLQHDPQNEAFFSSTRPGHYLADLYAVARLRLNKIGINLISGGEFCTYRDDQFFYSYRRAKQTGRQASLIYINKK